MRWLLGGAVLVAGMFLILLGEDVPPPLARGASAPGFSLPEHGADRTISLAEKRGQVVFVNFWATWCKPCEDEIPAMERLYQSLRGQGFEILAISVDEDAELVSEFQQRLGISFPILLDPGQSVSKLYQTTGFPETILVDRKGRVVERYVGPKDWDADAYQRRLRALLADGPGR